MLTYGSGLLGLGRVVLYFVSGWVGLNQIN